MVFLGTLPILLVLRNGCMWFVAAGLATGLALTVGVGTQESCTGFGVVVVQRDGSFINPIEYGGLNAGAVPVTDFWWCIYVNFKICIRIYQGDCSSAAGYSELDAVLGHENGRSGVTKHSLPLAVVDQEHHQTAEDSIARPPMWEPNKKWSCCWGVHTMCIKLLRGKPLE